MHPDEIAEFKGLNKKMIIINEQMEISQGRDTKTILKNKSKLQS